MGFRAIVLHTFGGLGKVHRVHRVIGFDSRAHNIGFYSVRAYPKPPMTVLSSVEGGGGKLWALGVQV